MPRPGAGPLLLDVSGLGFEGGERLWVISLDDLEELTLFPADMVVQPKADLAQKIRVARGRLRIEHAPLGQSPERAVLVEQASPERRSANEREQQPLFIIKMLPDLGAPCVDKCGDSGYSVRLVQLGRALQVSCLDQPVHVLPRQRLERRVTLQWRGQRSGGVFGIVRCHQSIVFRMCASLNILGRGPDHGFDEPLGLLTDCHRRIESFLGILLRVARERRGQTLDPQHAEAVRKAQSYFAQAAPRHTADEEESLFPRVRAASTGGADSLAALDRLHAEHDRADAMHTRVDGLLTAWLRDGTLPVDRAAELNGLLESLETLYREHIHVEESVVFPLAGRVLSGDDLARVGAEMRDRRGLTPRP